MIRGITLAASVGSLHKVEPWIAHTSSVAVGNLPEAVAQNSGRRIVRGKYRRQGSIGWSWCAAWDLGRRRGGQSRRWRWARSGGCGGWRNRRLGGDGRRRCRGRLSKLLQSPSLAPRTIVLRRKDHIVLRTISIHTQESATAGLAALSDEAHRLASIVDRDAPLVRKVRVDNHSRR